MDEIPDNIVAKINARGVVDNNECWVWLGARSKGGYGNIRVAGKTASVHRVAYQAAHGSIPEGMTIDHLCRNRLCFNPAHLEAVTASENSKRTKRDHCSRGHAKTPDNLIISPRTGHRKCRICHRERERLAR